MANPPDDFHNSYAPFPTTSWTLVTDLQQLSADRRRVLFDEWIVRYWKPLYTFFRSKQQSREQAADLVQGFLERFLAGDKIMQLNNQEQRFRDWLLVSARNFLIDELRKAKAAKRRPALGVMSIEELRIRDGDPYEPAADDSPETAYFEAWRRNLLELAMRAVAAECDEQDCSRDFHVFCDFYVNELAGTLSWEDVAARHGLPDARAAARTADRIKARLKVAMRRELQCSGDREEEINAEVRAILFDQ
jgi:RNA polymerase sigma factor (sigma-70 family)